MSDEAQTSLPQIPPRLVERIVHRAVREWITRSEGDLAVHVVARVVKAFATLAPGERFVPRPDWGAVTQNVYGRQIVAPCGCWVRLDFHKSRLSGGSCTKHTFADLDGAVERVVVEAEEQQQAPTPAPAGSAPVWSETQTFRWQKQPAFFVRASCGCFARCYAGFNKAGDPMALALSSCKNGHPEGRVEFLNGGIALLVAAIKQAIQNDEKLYDPKAMTRGVRRALKRQEPLMPPEVSDASDL